MLTNHTKLVIRFISVVTYDTLVFSADNLHKNMNEL